MKYYAEFQTSSIPMSFEFETEELRGAFIAQENAKLEKDYNEAFRTHEMYNNEFKKLAERCEKRFEPQPFTRYKECFAPLTQEEFLKKYGTRVHKRIYSLEDMW